jgi:hypothetical protein
VIVGSRTGEVRVLRATDLHAPAQASWTVDMDAARSWNPECEREADSDDDDEDDEDEDDDEDEEEEDDSVDAAEDSVDDDDAKDDAKDDEDSGMKAAVSSSVKGWGGAGDADTKAARSTAEDDANSSTTSSSKGCVFTEIINMAVADGRLFIRTLSDDVLVYE